MDPDQLEIARQRILAGMPMTTGDPYGDFLSYLSTSYPDYTTTDYRRTLSLNPHWRDQPYRVPPMGDPRNVYS